MTLKVTSAQVVKASDKQRFFWEQLSFGQSHHMELLIPLGSLNYFLSCDINDCGFCLYRPTFGVTSISSVKRPPSLNSMVFPTNTSTLPGSSTPSLLNPNFFPSPLDFQCQGTKHWIIFSIFPGNICAGQSICVICQVFKIFDIFIWLTVNCAYW